MPLDEVAFQAEKKMEKAVAFLAAEFRSVRTGRATTGLVEHIKVDYYGSSTPLQQLAALSAPEANLIVIKPFDPSSIKDIERYRTQSTHKEASPAYDDDTSDFGRMLKEGLERRAREAENFPEQ